VTQQINQETAGAEQWHALAQQLRVDSIRSSTGAGSGLLIVLALFIDLFFIGLSLAASLGASGASRQRVITTTSVCALLPLAGARACWRGCPRPP
jgi:hypothetical protein